MLFDTINYKEAVMQSSLQGSVAEEALRFRRVRTAGFVGGVVLIFCMYHFFDSESKMTMFDGFIFGIVLLASGAALIIVPMAELFLSYSRLNLGMLAYASSGAVGILLGAGYLLGVCFNSWSVYDFARQAVIPLIGVTTIIWALVFFGGPSNKG